MLIYDSCFMPDLHRPALTPLTSLQAPAIRASRAPDESSMSRTMRPNWPLSSGSLWNKSKASLSWFCVCLGEMLQPRHRCCQQATGQATQGAHTHTHTQPSFHLFLATIPFLFLFLRLLSLTFFFPPHFHLAAIPLSAFQYERLNFLWTLLLVSLSRCSGTVYYHPTDLSSWSQRQRQTSLRVWTRVRPLVIRPLDFFTILLWSAYCTNLHFHH